MTLTIIQAIDLARKDVQDISSSVGFLNTESTQKLLDCVDEMPSQPASLMILFDALADLYNNVINPNEDFTYEQKTDLRDDLQTIRLSLVNYLANKI